MQGGNTNQFCSRGGNGSRDLFQETPMEIDSLPTNTQDQSLDYVMESEDNEKQMLRLIQQYLHGHGYPEVANELESRSKVHMEDSTTVRFREHVLAGEFNQARALLSKLQLPLQLGESTDQTPKQAIEYQIYEQEYLELLESGRKLEAIQLLQNQLMSRIPKANVEGPKERLHFLAKLIMCRTDQVNGKTVYQSELRKHAKWKGSGGESRKELLEKVQEMMPAHEMLPPKRLEGLMKQAVKYQIHQCVYHNLASIQGAGNSYSLLEDHKCLKQQMIPTKCLAVLSRHRDEVWLVKFSPSGTLLATIGKDCLIYIWSIVKVNSSTSKLQNHTGVNGLKKSANGQKYRIKCTHEIKGHTKQVNALNWSVGGDLDSKFIVTASADKTAKVWDAKTGRLIVDIHDRHQESIVSAAFVPGQANQLNTRLVTAGVDKLAVIWDIKPVVFSSHALNEGSQIYEYQEITRLETRNYLDIAISSGRLALMGQNHFQVISFPSCCGASSVSNTSPSNEDLREAFGKSSLNYEVETNESVTSIAISKDGRYLLANVSLKEPRLELYDLGATSQISRKAELVRRFKGGHTQSMYVLRCAFGGAAQQFVLCGSEDATISLWNRDKGEIIARVGDQNGHRQVVNCVNWNPTDHRIFATASDDQTVRIWGVEDMPLWEIGNSKDQPKRIDLISSSSALPGQGDEEGQRNQHMSGEDESDISEDDIDDDEEERDEDYEEEEEEAEESMEEQPPRSSAQQRPVTILITTTRVEGGPSQRRRDNGSEEEDDEDDNDWAEGEEEGQH